MEMRRNLYLDKPLQDERGVLTMGVLDFLLNEDSFGLL